MIAAARLFAAAIEHMQEGYDWDGCDLQATCKKIGLTKERLYDPANDFGIEAGTVTWSGFLPPKAKHCSTLPAHRAV